MVSRRADTKVTTGLRSSEEQLCINPDVTSRRVRTLRRNPKQNKSARPPRLPTHPGRVDGDPRTAKLQTSSTWPTRNPNAVKVPHAVIKRDPWHGVKPNSFSGLYVAASDHLHGLGTAAGHSSNGHRHLGSSLGSAMMPNPKSESSPGSSTNSSLEKAATGALTPASCKNEASMLVCRAVQKIASSTRHDLARATQLLAEAPSLWQFVDEVGAKGLVCLVGAPWLSCSRRIPFCLLFAKSRTTICPCKLLIIAGLCAATIFPAIRAIDARWGASGSAVTEACLYKRGP